jgi:hypothetical protein
MRKKNELDFDVFFVLILGIINKKFRQACNTTNTLYFVSVKAINENFPY